MGMILKRATQSLLRDAYLTEKCSWNEQCRAHSQDDKSEFPAFEEADDDGCDEGDVGLDQLCRLVANTLLDLIDITVHGNTNKQHIVNKRKTILL